MLSDFGGHEAACGLTIARADIDRFRDNINKYAKNNIMDRDLMPKIDIDMDISLSEVDKNVINELELLKPYGPGNARPIFSSRGVYIKEEPRFIGKGGYKMWVSDGNATCEAVNFRKNSFEMPKAGEIIDIAYSPSINDWQGIESIQLDLCDVKVSEVAKTL
jgi:single-stranded-DNA-specific exonuclease